MAPSDPTLTRRQILDLDAAYPALASGLIAIILSAVGELNAMADGAPSGRRKLRNLAERMQVETETLRRRREAAVDALAALDLAAREPQSESAACPAALQSPAQGRPHAGAGDCSPSLSVECVMSSTDTVPGNYFSAPDWQDIATAPRDGTLIEVMDPDLGAFPMRWSPTQTNGLFPGAQGFWVTRDGTMTWSEHDGFGPTKWRPLDAATSRAKAH